MSCLLIWESSNVSFCVWLIIRGLLLTQCFQLLEIVSCYWKNVFCPTDGCICIFLWLITLSLPTTSPGLSNARLMFNWTNLMKIGPCLSNQHKQQFWCTYMQNLCWPQQSRIVFTLRLMPVLPITSLVVCWLPLLYLLDPCHSYRQFWRLLRIISNIWHHQCYLIAQCKSELSMKADGGNPGSIILHSNEGIIVITKVVDSFIKGFAFSWWCKEKLA